MRIDQGDSGWNAGQVLSFLATGQPLKTYKIVRIDVVKGKIQMTVLRNSFRRLKFGGSLNDCI